LVTVQISSASEMTYVVSGGALNSTHLLRHSRSDAYSAQQVLLN